MCVECGRCVRGWDTLGREVCPAGQPRGTWRVRHPPKLLHLPYVKGVSERIEKMCHPLGVKTVMKTADTVT